MASKPYAAIRAENRKRRQARRAATRHIDDMKHGTRSFYELAVTLAIERVVAGLDDALDLQELARGAAMSTFHFHRVFTSAAELRSDAGIVVSPKTALPTEVVEQRIPGGRYAVTIHIGPYERLGDTWTRLMGQWLPNSGHRMRCGLRASAPRLPRCRRRRRCTCRRTIWRSERGARSRGRCCRCGAIRSRLTISES